MKPTRGRRAAALLLAGLIACCGLLASPGAAVAQDDGQPVLLGGAEEEAKELAELERNARDPFLGRAERIVASLDQAYGAGFWSYLYDEAMPRPYLVAWEFKANVDRETIAKEYAEIFGGLYEVFYREFGQRLELEPIHRPVVVLVFDGRESYKKVRESRPELRLVNEEFVAGYYSPATGILTQWRQENLWEVMFHEGTHQLVDYATRKFDVPQTSESPWFQEGFADFMGGHTRKLTYSEAEGRFKNEFTLGQFLPGRYTAVQKALMSEDGYSLRELVCLDFITFKVRQNQQEGSSENQVKTQFLYAQGWALVMFLNYFDGGYYKSFFDEYLEAEIKGRGGCETFAEIFMLETDDDWRDLEQAFRDYVFGDLRAMRRQKDG